MELKITSSNCNGFKGVMPLLRDSGGGGSRGLVVKVLDSKFEVCDPHWARFVFEA